MEEIPNDESRKQHENNFLKRLIDFNQFFVLPDNVSQALMQLHNQEYGTTYRETVRERAGRLSLADIFLSIVHGTQRLMVFLSPEEGMRLAQEKIPYILKQLAIYYRFFYNEDPSEDFLDKLDTFIYQAICLNYQSEALLARDTELMLENAYALNSTRAFRNYLYMNSQSHTDMINALDFIPREQKKAVLEKIKIHEAKLVQTYLKNTRPTSSSFSYYFLMSMLLLGALFLYVLRWTKSAIGLALYSSFSMAGQYLRGAQEGRKATPTFQAEYTKKVMNNLRVLEVTKGFKGKAQEFRAKIDEADKVLEKARRRKFSEKMQKDPNDQIERAASEKKADTVAEIRKLYVLMYYGFKKFKMPKIKSNAAVVSNIDEMIKPAEIAEEIYCTFNHNPDSDAYDLRALRRCYIARREREASRKENIAQTSYTKVAAVLYKLDPKLQSHACLVIEQDSKMIFD
jgi:DNA-directed RNA polymerase subunit H (RpoH/RPB5)